MKNYTILIIEDESTINRLVCDYVKANNYTVLSALDGKRGLDLYFTNQVDVVCLDIMMPKVNGWDVAKRIREHSDVPIIMMSALSEDEDILKGYSLKVDDYITKPFNPKILIAKIENILSRITSNHQSKQGDIITTKNIIIDFKKHRAYINDEEVSLSKTEFDLLAYFLKNEGMICSRDHLLDHVWGTNVFVEDRIVDTYIKKLRKHLGSNAHYIKTVFGVGYRFETFDA